ncbi:MAG: hypothetical protein ABR541_08465 [Candidatus Dormibacteria bacterium]
MAVLVVARVNGSAADAEQWRERNRGLPKQQGFLFMADGPTDEGWRVLSAWESRGDFEKYFDAAVKPNLPPGVDGMATTEFHELASVVK